MTVFEWLIVNRLINKLFPSQQYSDPISIFCHSLYNGAFLIDLRINKHQNETHEQVHIPFHNSQHFPGHLHRCIDIKGSQAAQFSFDAFEYFLRSLVGVNLKRFHEQSLSLRIFDGFDYDIVKSFHFVDDLLLLAFGFSSKLYPYYYFIIFIVITCI